MASQVQQELDQVAASVPPVSAVSVQTAYKYFNYLEENPGNHPLGPAAQGKRCGYSTMVCPSFLIPLPSLRISIPA